MSTPRPTVLLMGGGYALSRLAEKLPADSCVLTTRSAEKQAAYLKEGKQCEIFEVSDISTLAAILAKYPSLHTAIDSIPPPEDLVTEGSGKPGKSATSIYEITECLKLSSVQRVLYLSTTGVYGKEDGGLVDEQTPTKPTSVKAKARLFVENAYRNSWLRSCCLRISGIYGPGRGIGQALRRGNYQLLSHGDLWSNRIHVDDLVHTVDHLLQLDTLPEVLCVSDDRPAQVREVIRYYCDRFGLPEPPQVAFDAAKESETQLQLPNQRVSNRLLREQLKVELRYPSFKEGAETEFEEGF